MVGSRDSIAISEHRAEHDRGRGILQRHAIFWRRQTTLIWQYMI